MVDGCGGRGCLSRPPVRAVSGDGVAAARSSPPCGGMARRGEKRKVKNEAKRSMWCGVAVFIARYSNGRGFIMPTISMTVAAQDGNGSPQSRARFPFPSVAAKDPTASLLMLSGTDIHSSVFSVKVVLECSTA